MIRVPRLVLLVLLALPGAQARATEPPPGHVPFMRGGLSVVFRHRRQPRVTKIIESRALPRAMWSDYPSWLEASHGRITLSAKHALTQQTLSAYESLLADRRFAARFGAVLPATSSPSPGRIEQAFVPGKGWDQLSPLSRVRAGRQMRVILGEAQRVLRAEQVDHNPYNFVFDGRGKVLGWVDWVMSDPRTVADHPATSR